MKKYAFLIVFLWLAASILLVPRIDAYNHAFAVSGPARDIPFLFRILGEGKSILSNLSILQADLYFHGGVGHFHEEHKDGLAIGRREEEHVPEEDVHEKEHRKAGAFNILFRIPEEIEVTEHIHLHADETKEMIPWLYYAAKVDPHNVLAYVLTSYWLADRLDRVDEGFSFLREGLLNNPDSWEISAELGRMYFVYRKDYKAAVRYLFQAQALMTERPHDKFQERYVLSYLALSYEALGQAKDALPIYRYLNRLFPGAYEKKIRELERSVKEPG